MQRIEVGPTRPDWESDVREGGLVYVDTEVLDPETKQLKVVKYWREMEHYYLPRRDIDFLALGSEKLFEMLIAAGDYIIDNNLFRWCGIPQHVIPGIKASWQEQALGKHWINVYGRYDIWVDRDTEGNIVKMKLLEHNAQTPTSFLEAAVIQWNWLLANHPRAGQWNDIYERTIDRWVHQLSRWQIVTGKQLTVVHVAYTSEDLSGEDMMNAGLMASAIEEAAKRMGANGEPAFEVKFIPTEEIDRKEYEGNLVHSSDFGTITEADFIDRQGVPIEVIFMLFPWEDVMIQDPDKPDDEFWGPQIAWNMLQKNGTMWVEQPWTWMWNKAVLPVLWKLFGNDPELGEFLLPAFFEPDADGNLPPGFEPAPQSVLDNCARKPLFGRQGDSVILTENGVRIAGEKGDYGAEGYIIQALAKLPAFKSELRPGTVHYPVLGVWMIGGEPSGLGIRETEGLLGTNEGLVTGDTAFFVPHITDLYED